MKIYVDDHNQGYRALPYGSVYTNGKLYRPGVGWSGRAHKGKSISPDIKAQIESEANMKSLSEHNLTDRERDSAAIFRQIANEILPMSVRMVEHIPGNHSSGFLPILDTEMAVKEGKFIFRHYSKPMASVELTLERTSMSMAVKLNILTAEGCR